MASAYGFCALVLVTASLVTAQRPPMAVKNPVQDIRIECNSHDIDVSIFTSAEFNGMVYPEGLSKNSSCMAEYVRQGSPVRYRLSLRSCNTMGIEQEDGIEYFNTIVVQPHRRLVTSQGRGFHVRCRYQTREKAAANSTALSARGPSALAKASALPICSMKLFSNMETRKVAETVKIGDPLTLEVSIDEQDVYGLRVVDCLVRDGLGWAEQQLINSDGCPVDFEILGPLKYSSSKTSASVSFLAHKFPYTASVYYQCNVRLCLKQSGGCDDVPPICKAGANLRRRRRELNATVTDIQPGDEKIIEVFSGLYVDESADAESDRLNDGPSRSEVDDDLLCISPRTFAIAIAIIGLLLMIAVVVAIMVIISRRRRRKDLSTTGSSIYSGPYTNTAYTHSS